MRNAFHVEIQIAAGAIAMNISTAKDAVRKHMIFVVNITLQKLALFVETLKVISAVQKYIVVPTASLASRGMLMALVIFSLSS